jgi:hypothetical protein
MFSYVVTPVKPYVLHAVGLTAAFSVVLGGVAPRFRRAPIVGLGVVVTTLGIGAVFSAMCCGGGLGSVVGLAVALCFGVVLDVFAIIALRRLLRWQVTTSSFSALMSVAFLELAIGVALLIVPFRLGISLMRDGVPAVIGLLGWMFAASSLTNLFDAAISIILFASALALLAHRAMWPLLDRPLYAIARLGLFRTRSARAVLVALGWEMSAVAINGTGTVLPFVFRIIRSA